MIDTVSLSSSMTSSLLTCGHFVQPFLDSVDTLLDHYTCEDRAYGRQDDTHLQMNCDVVQSTRELVRYLSMPQRGKTMQEGRFSDRCLREYKFR